MKYGPLLLSLLLLGSIKTLPDYQSQTQIPYTYYTVKRGDTLYKLFRHYWPEVARFNRLDHRHLMPGMRIKAPQDLEALKRYAPVPSALEHAQRDPKYIYVDLDEQFLGLYEFGKLVFSAPISSAERDCTDEEGLVKSCYTPSGKFKITSLHRDHVSSIYRDAEGNQIPMPFAALFFLEPTEQGQISYWLHAGDLPGYPASHGCIRLMLDDAKYLFAWLGGNVERSDRIWIKNGPVVEVVSTSELYVQQGSVRFIQLPEGLGDQMVEAILKRNAFRRELSVLERYGDYFVLLPIDLAEKPVVYSLEVLDRATGEHRFQKTVIVGKGAFPRHVSKGWNTRRFTDAELRRIQKEKQAIATSYEATFFTERWVYEGFEFPIERTEKTGQVTHPFGEERVNPKNAWIRSHRGIDIRAPEGFPIKSIAPGVVSFIGRDHFLEGNITIINHGAGVFSLYMHQSKTLVSVGDVVAKGEIIGEVGQTGNANGPHLHLAVRVNGALIDPMQLLSLFDE